jgi:hypothetical protein
MRLRERAVLGAQGRDVEPRDGLVVERHVSGGRDRARLEGVFGGGGRSPRFEVRALAGL